VIKGTLGGLMFWWLGLPAALLWGVVMGVLSVIPIFGAFSVWIPAVLILAAEGSWIKAAILTVWGGIVMGGIDNVLYPILIGNRLKLHTLLMFVSVVGGLIAFGPAGIILGPVVVASTMTLIEAWREREQAARNVNRPGTPHGQ
jgi:predicted PurR-regulated permease PerM